MKKKVVLFILSLLAVVLLAVGLTACDKAEDFLYSAPENIAYDGQYITWSKTDGAKHYTVAIDGGNATRSNSTSFTYSSDDTFEVTVTAVFEHTEKSSSVTFKPLDAIENITVTENGEIDWPAVNGASAYSLSINGVLKTVTDTHYDALPEGDNRVKVKPVVSGDNTFYSYFSKEVSVFIYGAPSNIKYDGVSVTWTGNAPSYRVTVNGVSNEVKGNSYTYNSQQEDFTVEIKALGNHTGTYDSKVCAEEFHYLASVKELFVEDGVLTWNEIDGAEGYKIKIGGVVQNVKLTTTSYDKIPAGRSLDICVMPYNESGNYFSSWSAEKTVYILDTPVVNWDSSLQPDGQENYNNLIWNGVNAASGYTVRLVKDGGAPEITNYTDIHRAFSYAYASVGVYTIEVKANAASGRSDYYDSKYSEPVTVERLASPRAADSDFIVSTRDNLARGFTVNFVKVNGASGYQLYKDGTLLEGKYTSGSALTDNNVADEKNIGEQTYKYSVRSMGGVKTVNNRKYVTLPSLLDKDALSFDITVQATPQDLNMNGFILSWNAVSGNNNYTVAYGGVTVTANSENYDLSTLEAGEYSVTVSARGNGGNVLASNPSAPFAIKRLEAPKNIKISADGVIHSENGQDIQVVGTGVLQWDAVSYATSYNVYLNGSKDSLDQNAYGNMYQYIETTGTTLSMVAAANYSNSLGTLYYMSSEASPTQQFIRLAAPTFPEGALANSVELVWNAPSNISTSEYVPTYQVKYDGEGHPATTGTKYNIAGLVNRQGGYAFTVKAFGNDTKYLDSEESVVINAYKIATPELRIENNSYVWDSVPLANSYYLQIDGTKVSDNFEGQSSYSYTPRFTEVKDHEVMLKAVGDGRGNLDSAFFVYKQKTAKLSAPVIKYGYSHDQFVASGNITVTITTPSENCTSYLYQIAGQTISDLTSEELSYSREIKTPGKYTVGVKALGGKIDENGVYYIDSELAGGDDAAITILGSPTSFEMQAGGQISWKGVSNAKMGYYYQISYDGGEYGEIKSTPGSSIDLGSDYKNHKTVKIKVWARGSSDGALIAGAANEWLWENLNYV